MFQTIAGPALDLLASHGLVVLFVLLLLDSAGIPLPTEILLIMAVALFATDTASLVMIVTLATGAALAGSLVLYGICYKGGRKLVEKRPKLFMMTPRRLARLERVFSHWAGKSLVFFLRLVPLTRVLVTIPAGIARMRPAVFLLLTFLGMAIYNVILVLLASRFGSSGDGGASLQATLATPAWQFVQANQILTFLALLVLGLLMSYRSSRSTIKDPQWSSPSKVGWLAERVAVYGGVVLFVVAVVDVSLAYEGLALTGLDLPALMEQINWDAASFLTVVSALAILFGFPALLYGRKARRRKWMAWQAEHGLTGTAEVTAKPLAATAAGQNLRAQGRGQDAQTIRGSGEPPRGGSGGTEPRWDRDEGRSGG